MLPMLALAICVCFIAAALRIESKANPFVSGALWIPTIWLTLSASKSLGRWQLALGFTLFAPGATEEAGSPLDSLVLSLLILLALFIIVRRKLDWHSILQENIWLFLLFFYMGASILWSDIPFVSFKRYYRALGTILVALIVLTESRPFVALESIFRRCAYILIPLSIVLIKYFPYLGVSYGRWSGALMWIGVSYQKNSFGQLCAFTSFFLIWAFWRDWRAGRSVKTKRSLIDILILALALFMLRGPGMGSYSATSVAMLLVSLAVLFGLSSSKRLLPRVSAHLHYIMIVAVATFALFQEIFIDFIASFLGRDTTLTGRTGIWESVSSIIRDPIFGIGFGGFHGAENVGENLSQTHNGYLSVYIELGAIGIILLGLFLLAFCKRLQKQICRSADWGLLGLCFLMMTLLVNNTEAEFLGSYLWSILIFLTIVYSVPCFRNCPHVAARVRLMPLQNNP